MQVTIVLTSNKSSFGAVIGSLSELDPSSTSCLLLSPWQLMACLFEWNTQSFATYNEQVSAIIVSKMRVVTLARKIFHELTYLSTQYVRAINKQ